MLHLTLPFPPSVNRYWRHVGQKTLISRKGREFRESVCSILAKRDFQPLRGDLAVSIRLDPPDRRRRDIDNFLKAGLDALEHAGVYENDAQIAHLEIDRGDRVPKGRMIVRIERHLDYELRRMDLVQRVCCTRCGRDTYRAIDDVADPYCDRCISHDATHAFPEEIDRRSDLPDDFDPRDDDEDYYE